MWVFYPLVDKFWCAALAVCLWFVLWPFVSPRPAVSAGRFRSSDRTPSTSGAAWTAYLLAGLAVGCLAWRFQAQRVMLGDADVFLHWFETVRGWMPEPYAPLDQWIRQHLLRWVSGITTIPALLLYRVYSCAALAALVTGSLALTRWMTPRRRFVHLGLLWTSGIALLGCGYLEIYPLATALEVLTVLAALRCMAGQGSRHPVTLLAALTLLAGTWQVMVILPLLAYLHWPGRRVRTAGIRTPQAAAYILSPVIVTLVVLWASARPDDLRNVGAKFLALELMPFVFGKTPLGEPGIFSIEHLANVTGTLVLLAPALPLGLLLLVSRSRPGLRRLATRRVRLLLVCGAVPLLFVFLRKPLGGMPRDWDLFAFAAPPLVLLLAEILHAVPRRNGRGAWITAALLAQLAVTGTWIGFNHAPQQYPWATVAIEGWAIPRPSATDEGLRIVAAWRHEQSWSYVDDAGTLYRQPRPNLRPRIAVIPERIIESTHAVPGDGGYWLLQSDGAVVRVADGGSIHRFAPAIDCVSLHAPLRALVRNDAENTVTVVDAWNRLFLFDGKSWQFSTLPRFHSATQLEMDSDGALQLVDRAGRIQILSGLWQSTENTHAPEPDWSYDSRRVPDLIVPDMVAVIPGPSAEVISVHQSGRIDVEGGGIVYDTYAVERRGIPILTAVYGPGELITLIDVRGGRHEVAPARKGDAYVERINIELQRRRPWSAMRTVCDALDRLPGLEPVLLPLARGELVHRLAALRVFTRAQIAPFASRLAVDAEGTPLFCDRWGRVFIQRDGLWRLDSASDPPKIHDLACDGNHLLAVDAKGQLLQLQSVSGTTVRPQLHWQVLDRIPFDSEKKTSLWRFDIDTQGNAVALDTIGKTLHVRRNAVWEPVRQLDGYQSDVEIGNHIYIMDAWGKVNKLGDDGILQETVRYDFGPNGARALVTTGQQTYITDLHGGVRPLTGTSDVLPNSPYVALDLYTDATPNPQAGTILLLTHNAALARLTPTQE